jgi:hypothetical protein
MDILNSRNAYLAGSTHPQTRHPIASKSMYRESQKYRVTLIFIHSKSRKKSAPHWCHTPITGDRHCPVGSSYDAAPTPHPPHSNSNRTQEARHGSEDPRLNRIQPSHPFCRPHLIGQIGCVPVPPHILHQPLYSLCQGEDPTCHHNRVGWVT